MPNNVFVHRPIVAQDDRRDEMHALYKEVYEWYKDLHPNGDVASRPTFQKLTKHYERFDNRFKGFKSSHAIETYQIAVHLKGDAEDTLFRLRFAANGYETGEM